MRFRRIIAAFLAVACAFFAPFMTPDFAVRASAASDGFKFTLSYKENYTAVKLTPSASGYYFRYTVNGKTPNANSDKYTATLKFKVAKTLKVIEYNRSGKPVSKVVSIDVKRGCMPVSFEVHRDKNMNYTVEISTVTEGADIYYTTNGSKPEIGASGTKKYTGAIKTAPGKKIKAFVVKDGYRPSKVTTYTINNVATVTEAANVKDISGDYDPIIGNILKAVNKERENNDLYGLVLNKKLCSAAAKRAKEIVKIYDNDHLRPNGDKWYTVLDDYAYVYSFAAENIGYCGGSSYNDDKAAKTIMEMWMKSPVHKANILNNNGTDIGIGFVKSGNYYYFVQIFGQKM